MKTKLLLTLFLTLGMFAGVADAKGQKQSHKNRDTNGDKVLSLEEFVANRRHPAKATKRFEKADANHDGQLDKSERTALKKHGDHPKAGKKHKRAGKNHQKTGNKKHRRNR